MSYRFIVADDHPLFRGALKLAIQGKFRQAFILEASNLDEVVTQLEKDDDIDLILLDLNMPGVKGFSGLLYLRTQYPTIPVVIVSATETPDVIQKCLDFDATGFIPKSLGSEGIRTAIDVFLSGDIWYPDNFTPGMHQQEDTKGLVARLTSLTPQQVRVLMMLSEGLLNKQIAYELDVSEATVKAHVSAILQKLNVESRTQAVIAASKIEVGEWTPDAN